MVDAQYKADCYVKVPGFATLQNPPPSSIETHISAWHMPEMVALVDKVPGWKCAHFNSCAYETDIEMGARHYKPQMIGGTLEGIDELNRTCPCGNKPHEPIVGKEKSKLSATYPPEFCIATTTPKRERGSNLELRKVKGLRISKVKPVRKGPRSLRTKLRLRQPQHLWERLHPLQGQRQEKWGLHRLLCQGQQGVRLRHLLEKGAWGNMEVPKSLVYIGGMRDPHKAVVKLPTLQALGQRMWMRWEKLVKRPPKALEVAETYGTADCAYNQEVLDEWRGILCELWGCPEPGVTLTARGRGPSRITSLSVEDEIEEANVELKRYEDLGYLRRIDFDTASEVHKNGTISKLGLVLKTRENGEKKRRIVIDLRRSGGNGKSYLPERLVLPRLLDAVKMMKEIRKRAGVPGAKEDTELELALVDVSDAFTVLPVAKEEFMHTLAPSTVQGELLVFQGVLFGYKVAPLLYSRFASLIARMLQSAIRLDKGGHQVYLDVFLWVVQGRLETRTSTLAFLLNAMGCLGIRIALHKDSRASNATWIGITLHLVDKDSLVVGLPEKFIDELHAGYAAVKELRSAAGKAAWLGGVLPRARWVTSVFYAVLTQTLKEEEETTETAKRNRKGLFAVKRLELARQWMISFLKAAKIRPMRRISLVTGNLAEIKVVTDASPLAILVALRRWSEKLKGTTLCRAIQSLPWLSPSVFQQGLQVRGSTSSAQSWPYGWRNSALSKRPTLRPTSCQETMPEALSGVDPSRAWPWRAFLSAAALGTHRPCGVRRGGRRNVSLGGRDLSARGPKPASTN
eukprot:s2661_g6.t1